MPVREKCRLARPAFLLSCLVAATRAFGQDALLPPASPSAAVDASGFYLSQHFADASIIVGENLTLDYRLENRGSAARADIVLEIYFLLENTRLVSAPSQCRRRPSLAGQEILHCAWGGFPPGGRRSFSVTVATSENSRPAVTASAFVGDLRVDAAAAVVRDTRSDSDGDGVSDFIEMLRHTDPADPASVDDSPANIDLMALYTPAAAALYPAGIENRINDFINAANGAYYHSKARIRLRPVHFRQVPGIAGGNAWQTLNELIDGSNAAFSGVAELRRRYGADLVVLFDVAARDASCGLAPVGGFGMQGDFGNPLEKAFGYSWIAVDCAEELALAHELGHNMGLTHSHREDGLGGTFDFATGYGVDGEFATVMATPSQFSVPGRTSVFSNPDLVCGESACGRPEDAQEGANATAALNIVAPQVEAWFARTMPELPAVNGQGVVAGPSSARLALAGQVNDELGYTDVVRVGDVLRLLAEVEVDREHIDMLGSFHILITADSGEFHQLDREIGITRWDGTLDGLRSATPEQALRPVERFHIADNYEVDAGFDGVELQIYLAYQIPGDVIYLPQPLRLRFAD